MHLIVDAVLLQSRFEVRAHRVDARGVFGIVNQQGRLDVDFVAANEPYTAFDFVELSVTPIQANAPEPGTLLLFGLGLTGLMTMRRMA